MRKSVHSVRTVRVEYIRTNKPYPFFGFRSPVLPPELYELEQRGYVLF